MPSPHSHVDFMPEPPGELLEAHALSGKPLAAALLRELAHREVPVALRRRCDPRARAMGRLVDCSDDALTLEPDDVEPGVLLAEDDDYVAVAYLDGVKIQFDARLRTGGQERRLLRGPAPLAVYRLQRREAYRVAVTARKGHCVLRLGPGDELAVGIVDLSARGLLLAWPRPTPPVIGTVWEHARIEFADRPSLPCTLVTCRTDAVDNGSRLVGCEFGPLPPEIERAVQVLVNDLQRGTPTIS